MNAPAAVPERTGSPTDASAGTIEDLELAQFLYRLFSLLFLYPHPDRLALLRAAAGELAGAVPPGGSSPLSPATGSLLLALGPEGNTAADLVSQYNRLFQVNPLAPPYESLYRSQGAHLRGWLVAQLEHEYRRHGLACSPELNELPDHLSVELEFMAFLCRHEAEALAAGDQQGADRSRDARARFLRAHLARWVPHLAELVQTVDTGGFYALALRALADFLASQRR